MLDKTRYPLGWQILLEWIATERREYDTRYRTECDEGRLLMLDDLQEWIERTVPKIPPEGIVNTAP